MAICLRSRRRRTGSRRPISSTRRWPILDDDERVAFVLFEVEGLTMDEIAQMLDWPPGTVASRLRRARGKVKAAAVRLEAAHGGGS